MLVVAALSAAVPAVRASMTQKSHGTLSIWLATLVDAIRLLRDLPDDVQAAVARPITASAEGDDHMLFAR